MSWNYRIFRREYPEFIGPFYSGAFYELQEVYYNKAGQIVLWGCGEPEAGPCGTVDELIEELRMKARDAWKSREDILDFDMEPEGDWDE